MADFGHRLKTVLEAMGSHTGVNELEGVSTTLCLTCTKPCHTDVSQTIGL